MINKSQSNSRNFSQNRNALIQNAKQFNQLHFNNNNDIIQM